MKGKQFFALAFAAIAACAVIGCGGDDPPEQQETPKERTAERIEFGTDNFTYVSSKKALTDEQWATVKSKLTTALDTTRKNTGTAGANCGVYFRGMVNIDLLETQEYNYYTWDLSDTSNYKLLYNANYVIGASEADLAAKTIMAVNGDPVQQ
jgi:hypothetical protein